MAKSGNKVPRPIAQTLHPEKPNEVVNFDFLYMGLGHDEHKYVLVIKDDLSSYVWLPPANSADESTAATELSAWIRTFSAIQSSNGEPCFRV